MLAHGYHTPSLAPRGPVLILGRPQLYPEEFDAQVRSELAAANRELYGRQTERLGIDRGARRCR